jgi:hypothetical protein
VFPLRNQDHAIERRVPVGGLIWVKPRQFDFEIIRTNAEAERRQKGARVSPAAREVQSGARLKISTVQQSRTD